MKKTIAGLLLFAAFVASPAHAIDVDEIISSYYENTGGEDAWDKLSGVKLTGEFAQGSQKFPFELVQLKGGKQYLKFTFQGKDIKQGVFDGTTMWNTNFMTMKAEKADAEATANQKLESNDFPSDLFHYKQKGYTAELLGNESIDGTDTYKIKLVKEPLTVDGKKVANITYYYFDTEALVPLVTESEIKSGPAKGKMGQNKLSDYQEVNGLYFPFSMTQGIKDGPSATMLVKKIELNPKVDDSAFSMPPPAPEAKPEPKPATKKAG